MSLLLGERLSQHERELLRQFLQSGRPRTRLLRQVMSGPANDAAVLQMAAHVWRHRLWSELEAAERFRALAPILVASGASAAIADMATAAAADELRHASLCRDLIRHFGGALPPEPQISLRWMAPADLDGRERVLYEVVALSCVTETLSTVLLGELVRRARDPVCRQAMHTILEDEVNHSRLGWALLAEEHARGAGDCVGRYLPDMLAATFSDELFMPADAPDARATELAGLGSLERPERQRIVREALAQVVFPGLERFGIETTLGQRWLEARQGRVASAAIR